VGGVGRVLEAVCQGFEPYWGGFSGQGSEAVRQGFEGRVGQGLEAAVGAFDPL
jgi:hypothetical protein